jgi:hypothetical protein
MPLIYAGDTDFSQIGPAKWGKSGWGMESLRLRYKGSRDDLDTFLATLANWDASGIDSHMFLESYDNDDHPIEPTVDLSYIGRRGGTLPPVQTTQGFSLQTASQVIEGEDPLQLEVLYRSPNTVMSWIGTSDALTYSGFSNPADLVIVQRRVNGHIPLAFRYGDAVRNSVSYGLATAEQRSRIDDWLASLAGAIEAAQDRFVTLFNRSFTQDTVITGFTSEELVPGEYYQNSTTTAVLLNPT